MQSTLIWLLCFAFGKYLSFGIFGTQIANMDKLKPKRFEVSVDIIEFIRSSISLTFPNVYKFVRYVKANSRFASWNCHSDSLHTFWQCRLGWLSKKRRWHRSEKQDIYHFHHYWNYFPHFWYTSIWVNWIVILWAMPSCVDMKLRFKGDIFTKTNNNSHILTTKRELTCG